LPEQRIIPIADDSPAAQNNSEIVIIESDEPEIELYQTHIFTEENERFIESSIFIGDGIFGGFVSGGILRAEQVFASDDTTASNAIEKRFPLPSDNSGIYLLTALVNQNPENVVILLGMNDILTSTAEEFCADYIKLISFIKTYCPDTIITVLSITPVRDESDTDNYTIDEYNEALRAAVRGLRDSNVRFLDITDELKTSHGRLKSRYAQDDGVHLTTQGLYAVLWVICNM
jgi:lysophospholipase L1-like esterase